MWSDLPPELLELILQKLVPPDFTIGCVKGFFSFKRVCHSWRTVADTPRSSRLPISQNPCLLLDVNEKYSSLLDPASEEVYHNAENVYYKDEKHDSKCVGSSYGWIVMLHKNYYDRETTVYLLNPITRARISIPNTRDLITKGIVSSNPSSNRHFYVVLQCGSYGDEGLAFYKHGGDKYSWTKFGNARRYDDIMFHNERLFALASDCSLEVWDCSRESSPVRTMHIQDSKLFRLSGENTYLVESLTGDILRANVSKISIVQDPFSDREYSVEKLNLSEEKWEKVESLVDQILYLYCDQLMLLSSPCFLGHRGNSMCFSVDDTRRIMTYIFGSNTYVVVESMRMRRRRMVLCKTGVDEHEFWSCDKECVWFHPNPW